MNWSDFFFSIEFWARHYGRSALLALVDDPAWLALIFC